MAVAQHMSEHEYEAFVLSGIEGSWELHDGRLVEKPGMSWKHSAIASLLGFLLQSQLDLAEYRVFYDSRVRRPAATIFLPDLMVVPVTYGEGIAELPVLAIFSQPLPLVVEVWSPSTGDYDVDTKIPAYRQRGDLDIWRIHPYERTLSRWVRQPEGAYAESTHHGGVVALAALPGVTIDLDRLFAS
ncbi:MAG: Uma2 family endonuclease [Thermomicrobiales bacterium]